MVKIHSQNGFVAERNNIKAIIYQQHKYGTANKRKYYINVAIKKFCKL